MRATLLLVFLALVLSRPGETVADRDPRPLEEQPFLGLSVRDVPDGGLVVAWILPGPLGGQGKDSTSGIQRDDNVVSVDGKPMDAAAYKAHVGAKKPGDRVTLVVRRSPKADPHGAVPLGGPGGEERTFVATLGSRAEWSGTVTRGLGGRRIPAPKAGAFEALLLEEASRLGVRQGETGVGGGLDQLLAHLSKVQEDALDPNSSAWVVNALRRPLSLDAVAADLLGALEPSKAASPEIVCACFARALDLAPPAASPPEAWHAVARSLPARPGVPAALRRLVARHRDEVIPGGPHAPEFVAQMSTVVGPRVAELLEPALVVLRNAPDDWERRAKDALAVAENPPGADPRLVPGVSGEILHVGEDALGRPVVVGGKGPNRYDMSRVAAVYDVGGNDVYVHGAEAEADGQPPVSIVIDLEGDDRHECAGPFAGPGTTVKGVAWLDDRAGNDTYTSRHTFSIATGLCGFGVLIDRAGNDTYVNQGEQAGWSMGVGWWGAGLLLDLAGSDTYRGEILCQGVGGPRGLGLLLDADGADRYDADGPSFPSAYGTPGVHVSMSQGFGYGVRGYAAGGVGALVDLGGDDRYVGGEFAQGGGYYFGLGLLHDRAGNDLYHGNRYGQAFAAHQAVGLLVDEAGDDHYWSMTAASQAGTWDQSVGLLLDRSGNDAYRCDGLGQGGAAMQAVALLVDLAGDDRYVGRGTSVQGQGGGNSYHFHAEKVFSFSALLDLGGGSDVYSNARKNGETKRTGAHNDSAPADSDLHGLFIDR
jgi:hypothetical protein